MIKVYNRKTKGYDVEKVVSEGLINKIYTTETGKLGLELLLKRKLVSSITGFFCDSKISNRKIQGFIDEYKIDMSECNQDCKAFKNFNEFFTRKLTSRARSFASDKSLLLSPGDGRLRAWSGIDVEKLVQIKGMEYSLGELLANNELAHKYKGGICIVLRLAPVDYHRFHFMDSGICGETTKVKGQYYSVNPIALNSITKVYCRNKREYSTLHSENFGDVLYIEVGATSVGAIIQTYKPYERLNRGDEKGFFKFGGSTVIMFLEKEVAKIDEEILNQTELGYETRVLAGEVIGIK